MNSATPPVAASGIGDAPTYAVPHEPWLRLFLRFLRFGALAWGGGRLPRSA